MNPELKAYLDAWEARRQREFENLMARLDAPLRPATRLRPANHDTTTASDVTELVTASSGTAELVTASAGLAAPPATVPIIEDSLAVALTAPIDTTSVTPATCSTGGLDHCTDGDNPVALFLIPGSALASFTAPPEDSTTPSIAPSAVFEYVRVPLTTCSTDCSDSDIGAPSPTTQVMPSRLLQAAAPVLTQELMVLCPMPWPSFECRSESTYCKLPYPTPQVHAALLSFWIDQTLPPCRASMIFGANERLSSEVEFSITNMVFQPMDTTQLQSEKYRANPTVGCTIIAPRIEKITDAVDVNTSLLYFIDGIKHSSASTIPNTTTSGLPPTPVHAPDFVATVMTSSSSTTAGMTRAADLDIVSVHVGEMPLRPEALFKVTRERQVLRPMPWPSFLNDQAAHGPAPYHSDSAIAKTHEAKHIGKPFLWPRPDFKLKNLHAMWLLIERILGWSLYLLGSVKMSTDKQDVPFNIVCLRFQQLGVFAVHLSGGNSLCLCHYTAAIGDTWYVSGSSSSDSMTFGSKEVQIVRLLTNIYCCNTTKSEVIQGNLSSSLNIMVMWYLDHGFMRIKKWWLDIHCSQLVNESFEASFWPEQHIIGNYVQVLVTDSLLQLFWSGSTPISLLENILVLTWRSIGLSVEQLSGATYSCAVLLYVASRHWIISWLEGSFELTTTRSSLQGEQITCSCPKTVTTQLLVSAETECLDSLLLIHAYLGGSCGLKWDINITLLHASKWSSSLHYKKLCNPSSFWSESTMYVDQFKDLFYHMDILLACMSGQQPIVLLPGHWFVPGMEHLQVLQDTSGFPWYYYLETLKYSCYCLATEDTTGFPASCSDWMSEIKNLVSYGVQEYTVNDFSERHLCGPAASYLVLINFWAMGTGYLQILQQLGNIELKENQISNNIDEQWPGQLVFLCSISDVMAYCFMPDSHSVGLLLSSVICEVVVPPVPYVPKLLCMQPITHKNEATSTLLMGLSAWGVPWDPGDLRIVFEDIHGERNTHFVRQVLLTIPCSSLMDGVKFSTSYGQAPFQGGRNFMILAAFVDHNYYLDAVLNLVPASHDEYRDPVRVNSGHGCDYEGYFGNPGEQAYYFGRIYIDLNYYHEDYHDDPSKLKQLQAPWDPGKSAFQSPAKFRLGVKPSFKEGGVLATCPLGGPATTRRHQGPAHHQLPVLHGLHIQQGRQRRGHPDGSRHWRLALSFLAPLLPSLAPLLISFLAAPCNPKHPYKHVIPVNE